MTSDTGCSQASWLYLLSMIQGFYIPVYVAIVAVADMVIHLNNLVNYRSVIGIGPAWLQGFDGIRRGCARAGRNCPHFDSCFVCNRGRGCHHVKAVWLLEARLAHCRVGNPGSDDHADGALALMALMLAGVVRRGAFQ